MVLLNAFVYKTQLPLIALVLFAGILLFYYLGVKIGSYIKLHHPETKVEGIGPLEGALLGLLSLLLSFTFGVSSSRYDARRSQIVLEANNISTVILRADMYPDTIRSQLRNDLQKYVETRIAYYNAGDDTTIHQLYADAGKLAGIIWERAIIVKKESPDFVRDNQMIPAINAMMDSVTERDASRLARVPDIIIYLLVSLTVLGSFIVGYGKKEKKNDWIILTLYSLMTVMTIYTILDLDRPRRGFIQTTTPHEKISELRNYFLSVDKTP
ncbi:hypothetical protein [Mucilaginibacter sp. OK098]|uniref:bestrophin-like domain n=1 Tax=Mucilaginibacter sp. OK098 TaxID=1855297 RepID=UPI000910BFCE|nr:hypothetical protein [Mucilaginibacter sp. OK098]SHM98577.1 hypothetical protein SAMN05216524_104423 [Mucilaginibacter sp. OK098]